MTNHTDKFQLFAPIEDESDKPMPQKLEVVDYQPTRLRAKPGADDRAYYERAGSTGETARLRKPPVDLRKLSEWIKTTTRLKAQQQEEGAGKKNRDQ